MVKIRNCILEAMSKTIPFGQFLENHNCSLIVSTYKSNLTLAISGDQGEVITSAWPMPRPMGIARLGNRLAIGTESVIVQYVNQPDLVSMVDGEASADAVFLKRSLHITGEVNIHDLSYTQNSEGEPELWFVNTKFSCLSTIDPEYSFVPKWKPDWISTLIGEDRCHLNGMESVSGKPRYVSSFSQTNSKAGWREEGAEKNLGVVLDIQSNQVVASGLHHPHSPTWYRNALYVLESGSGSLCRINLETNEVKRITSLAGYVRGLDFINGYAVIGLSKIRKTNSSKLALEEPEDLKAGIGIINLESGQVVSSLRFDDSVNEIYDIAILEGVRRPIFAEHNAATGHQYVLPAELKAAFSGK